MFYTLKFIFSELAQLCPIKTKYFFQESLNTQIKSGRKHKKIHIKLKEASLMKSIQLIRLLTLGLINNLRALELQRISDKSVGGGISGSYQDPENGNSFVVCAENYKIKKIAIKSTGLTLWNPTMMPTTLTTVGQSTNADKMNIFVHNKKIYRT